MACFRLLGPPAVIASAFAPARQWRWNITRLVGGAPDVIPYLRSQTARCAMPHTSEVEATSGRKFYLDVPDDIGRDEPVTLILNLHGGGSVGSWQRAYFPAQDYANPYRLVIA